MHRFADTRLNMPRLHLRPLLPRDAPAVWRIFSDAQVMRYWSTPPWTQPDEAAALIERDRLALASGDHLRLALTLVDAPAASAPVLGLCTLFDFMPTCRRAELGYVLARHAWGQGLMHEALLALLAFGFGQLQLNRVEADVDPRNRASMRTLQRLGFQQEGLLRERWIVAGEVSDSALFGLLQGDFKLAEPDAQSDAQPSA